MDLHQEPITFLLCISNVKLRWGIIYYRDNESVNACLFQAPAVVDEKELEDIEPAGALLRIKMWLGLESKWKREMNQSLALYAETYENEV